MQTTKPLTIAILIPAHNEEQMIGACVDSCLAQTRPADEIIVVNDGSTDRTGEILATYGDRIRVITTPVATGNKSRAQEIGINALSSNVFVATDGDTILDSNFVLEVEKSFLKNSEISAFAGQVQSTTYNYLTAIREIDYVIGQDLYKKAQSYINQVMVIPGCSGAFKTSLFHENKITFDHDTLTEDFDFTYKLHEQDLLICYNQNAICYTQDPHTLSSYLNQMRRWYGGGWQNLEKHINIVRKRPSAALLISMGYFEGLGFSILFFLLPIVNFALFLNMLWLYLIICMISGAYASARRRRADLFVYSPLMVLIGAINAWIFLERFVVEIVLRKKNMTWFHPERRLVLK